MHPALLLSLHSTYLAARCLTEDPPPRTAYAQTVRLGSKSLFHVVSRLDATK